MRDLQSSKVGLYLSRVMIGLVHIWLAISVGGEVVVPRVLVLGWITDVGPALHDNTDNKNNSSILYSLPPEPVCSPVLVFCPDLEPLPSPAAINRQSGLR